MIRSYNGRPLREGIIQGFCSLPLNDLQNIKCDLGLSMSLEELASLQKSFNSKNGQISTDELYMIDAYIDTSTALAEDITFPELRTNSELIEETIRDIMQKRHATASQMPISFTSVANVYKNYLKCAGYDNEGVRPKQKYSIIEKTPSASSATAACKDRHTIGSLYGTDETNFALSTTDSVYHFNTQKERVYPSVLNRTFHLLMVKLDDTPFAFEELANIIHSNSHLSKDIIYCAPVGNAGIISALHNTSHGYVINCDTVSALMDEELNPFALNLKMNAAVLIVDAEDSQNIAMSILDFGYNIRLIGQTTLPDGTFSVLHRGIYHNLDTKAADKLITAQQKVLTLRDENGDKPFLSTTRIKENISLTAFSSTSFSSLCKEILNAIKNLSADHEGLRPYAYLALPVYDCEICFSELLAVYRALAEHSVPLVKYSFIPSTKRENAALFLVCDDKVTT